MNPNRTELNNFFFNKIIYIPLLPRFLQYSSPFFNANRTSFLSLLKFTKILGYLFHLIKL